MARINGVHSKKYYIDIDVGLPDNAEEIKEISVNGIKKTDILYLIVNTDTELEIEKSTKQEHNIIYIKIKNNSGEFIQQKINLIIKK